MALSRLSRKLQEKRSRGEVNNIGRLARAEAYQLTLTLEILVSSRGTENFAALLSRSWLSDHNESSVLAQ